MIEHTIKLTPDELKILNDEFPETNGNKPTELRAEEIVKIYFRRSEPDCKFSEGTNGSDLKIYTGKNIFEIEVKGTKTEDVAWTRLKINGKPSYKRLKEDLPMYRVTGVFKSEPKIIIMKYSEDFEMIQEDRWRVRKRKV